MLPPFFSDLQCMSVSVCFRFFDIQKDLFHPQGIGQKKPAFFNVWIFGARKKYRAMTVCLLQELCHFTLKPYCIQQILLSQNTFLFCHASLGIFLFDILLFFTQKNPTLFAKKGGKMKVFFNFFDFFHAHPQTVPHKIS